MAFQNKLHKMLSNFVKNRNTIISLSLKFTNYNNILIEAT